MRMTFAAAALAICVLAGPTAPAPAAAPARARDVLPAEGLIGSSVVVLRDQAALDAHYYLADESALALGRKADAVLARYSGAGGGSILLVIAYSSAEEAGRAYGRFGADFFSESFDPMTPRVVERLETGDWAGAARRGRFLIVVLESPDRDACDGLLRRAEDRAPVPKAR
jgi:hypothetical protein